MKVNQVLWWVPEGHIPTLSEGAMKLKMLRENGPSAEAFGFREAMKYSH